jgi:hypothetical protein
MPLNDTKLCEFDHGQDTYTVGIQFDRDYHNEDELLLQLCSEEIAIYTLTFSIVPEYALGNSNDGYVLLISRMQGRVGVFQEIRLATKDI